jgi:hypothetical protein
MGPPREVARDEPVPAPAEPEVVPAAAAWAVERVEPRPARLPERAARVGPSEQEQREKQDMPHVVEH